MREIARSRNGHWVEVETADDVEAVNRRSRTYLGGHLQGGMGAFGYRFVALAWDRGPTMPVAALLSAHGPSMVCGLSNGNPFPGYQDDILSLGNALGMRIPPTSYPYRGSGAFGVVPAMSEVTLTPLFDDGGDARWVIVANAADDAMTALGGFVPITAALPLDRRDRERGAGAIVLALEVPADDAPSTYPTIVMIPPAPARRAGTAPKVVAADGRNPYRKPEIENLIEALGTELGIDLSEDACDVPKPHRPGPSM